VFQSGIAKLFKRSYYGQKSFTYFLPAPPQRNTGYQEKEFDLIISYLNKKGYDVLDFRTESINYGENGSSAGIWIVCLLGLTKESLIEEELNIDYLDISKSLKSNIELDPDIIHD